MDVDYFSFKAKETKSDSWFVDIPFGLRGQARKREILAQVLARMQEQYAEQRVTRRELEATIFSIEIRSEE